MLESVCGFKVECVLATAATTEAGLRMADTCASVDGWYEIESLTTVNIKNVHFSYALVKKLTLSWFTNVHV